MKDMKSCTASPFYPTQFLYSPALIQAAESVHFFLKPPEAQPTFSRYIEKTGCVAGNLSRTQPVRMKKIFSNMATPPNTDILPE